MKVGSVGLTHFTGKFRPKKVVSAANDALLNAKRVSSRVTDESWKPNVTDEPWKPDEIPLEKFPSRPPEAPPAKKDKPERGVEDITLDDIIEWF